MNQQTSDQTLLLIGSVFILSGLALVIGSFVVPLATELEPTVRFLIVMAGVMDLIFGIASVVLGQRGQ